MENRENLFNRTSLMIEKNVEKLFKNTFSIMTEVDCEDGYLKEKQQDLLSTLINYGSNETVFNIIREKSYEFCLKNKDNVIRYDDNGISIGKKVDDNNGIPVIEVFVELYKYFIYVENACRFANNHKLESKDIENIYAPEMAFDYEYLYPNKMDQLLEFLEKFIHEFIPDSSQFNYDYEYIFAVDNMIKGYTDIQRCILFVYLESVCHVFNNIRHNPEIFKEKLGISINDLYSEKYIYTVFTTRDRFISNHYDVVKNFDGIYRARTAELPFTD